MGKGVRFLIQDEKQKELTDSVLDEQYSKDTIFEIAKESSKCGIAYELLYINEQTELKSKMFGARDFIPIYSNRVGEFLEGAIRLWQEDDIFDTSKITYYAALYTKDEIITYRKAAFDTTYVLYDREFHMFTDVPVIVYQNNKECTSDYEDIISLVDAYDKAQSDTANDFEYFTDAYLAIAGAKDGFDTDNDDDGENVHNQVRTMKEERVLLLDEKGQAQWLIKNINDTAIENYKDRLKKDMFFLAFVPALSDESFGQNLSGVAIEYKLIGLEELSVIKENKFRASLKKKLKLATDFINLKYCTEFNPDDIQIKFDRNLIRNMAEKIESTANLEGVTSKRTQLEQLPFIDDPEEEFQKMLEEQAMEENYQKVDEKEIDDFYLSDEKGDSTDEEQ